MEVPMLTGSSVTSLLGGLAVFFLYIQLTMGVSRSKKRLDGTVRSIEQWLHGTKAVPASCQNKISCQKLMCSRV